MIPMQILKGRSEVEAGKSRPGQAKTKMIRERDNTEEDKQVG